MGVLVLLLGVIPYFAFSLQVNNAEPAVNVSDLNNDMYVINAMVYQIGIVTNKTDNDTSDMNATGNQETLTFYRNNGSMMNLSGIPEPLLTNVTAQSLVGLAPLPESTAAAGPWTTLQHLAAGRATPDSEINPEAPTRYRLTRNVHYETNAMDNADWSSGASYYNIFKRGATNDTELKIVNGSAVVPQAAGVQSIAIPALLTLNSNFSEIPVPIPNISVVHYAKINTLVSTP